MTLLKSAYYPQDQQGPSAGDYAPAAGLGLGGTALFGGGAYLGSRRAEKNAPAAQRATRRKRRIALHERSAQRRHMRADGKWRTPAAGTMRQRGKFKLRDLNPMRFFGDNGNRGASGFARRRGANRRLFRTERAVKNTIRKLSHEIPAASPSLFMGGMMLKVSDELTVDSEMASELEAPKKRRKQKQTPMFLSVGGAGGAMPISSNVAGNSLTAARTLGFVVPAAIASHYAVRGANRFERYARKAFK